LPWYLVQTRPNAATMAERGLARQGFEIFAPKLRWMLRVRNGFKPTLGLLFPGYLFVRIAPEQPNWRAVGGTRGVIRLVSFDATGPAPVDSALVGDLQARCDSGGLISPRDRLSPGDTVRVDTGPFAELTGKVETLDADARVVLLLDIMGRATRMTMPRASVRRCDITT